MATSVFINSLMERMNSPDKDIRYMATNDLIGELKKESFGIEETLERKVVHQVLKLLEDKNGEVQNLVVKGLAPLTSRIRETQQDEVLEGLMRALTSGQDDVREVASIGLKTLVLELPPAATVTANIIRKLLPRLLNALKNKATYEVIVDVLDVLAEVIYRFAALITAHQQALLDALLPNLLYPRPLVRKRAVLALGHLVKALADKAFFALTEHLIAETRKATKADDLRSLIACIGTISRHSGKRIGKYLETLAPLTLANIRKDDDLLREICFQTLESLATRCPEEAGAFVEKIVDACLEYIKHDPNYVADDEEDEMAVDGDDDDDADDDAQGGADDREYSDDDDVSWKVRRAAVNTLRSLILTRPDVVPYFYTRVAPVLVARFREREDNVRLDVLATFITLLEHTNAAGRVPAADSAAARAAGKPVTVDGTAQSLHNLVPTLVRAVARRLKDAAPRNRQTCFTLLKELVQAQGGALNAQLAPLVPGTLAVFKDKTATAALRIEALAFLRHLFRSHPAATLLPTLGDLLPPILTATTDRYAKTAVEALLASMELTRTLRPVQPEPVAVTSAVKDALTRVQATFLGRLKAQDVDQEVKETAIQCQGVMLVHAGDLFADDLPTVLSLLLERLRNEVTRLTAARTLAAIARAKVSVPLTSVLAPAAEELATYLRKTSRPLKLAALSALTAITTVPAHASVLAPKQYLMILQEVRVHISDADLQLLPLALQLVVAILQAQPTVLGATVDTLGPALSDLVRSPLLQGASMRALLEVYSTLVRLSPPTLDLLLPPLLVHNATTVVPGNKQAFASRAQCIAVLATAAPADRFLVLVNGFVSELTNKDNTDAGKYLALHTLGEIGRRRDLSHFGTLHELVVQMFAANSEDLKTAAAFALGNIAVGNLGKYLPFILAELRQQPKRQYLLLSSLREIISQESQRDGGRQLSPYAQDIWLLLFNNGESEEEGTRNVVAECLGRFTLLNPALYLAELQGRLQAPSAATRATVVMALRFTFNETAPEYDTLLRPIMAHLGTLMADSDLTVKRVSLQALNSLAHNKQAIVRDLLPGLFPVLYDGTIIRKELIREVEMGPFKHEVDDGLDIRKAAYECMYTILETCRDRTDLFAFMDRLVAGLQDRPDIRELCHLMLIRLAQVASAVAVQKLDDFAGPLETTITTKPKATAVKQEIEKNDELVRSGLRALAALSKVPDDAATNPRFKALLALVAASPELAPKLKEAQAEAEARDTTLDLMDA